MSKLTPLYRTLGSRRWMKDLTNDEFRELAKLWSEYHRELEIRVGKGISPFNHSGRK